MTLFICISGKFSLFLTLLVEGGQYQDEGALAGEGWRSEVQNKFACKHLLPESACEPWIGIQKMSCTSFRPGWGGEEIGESESLSISSILLIVYWDSCQCLIRP